MVCQWEAIHGPPSSSYVRIEVHALDEGARDNRRGQDRKSPGLGIIIIIIIIIIIYIYIYIYYI